MAFEYLAVYSTFQSVEGMDSAVKQHMNQYRLDLTASERAVVFTLASHSLTHVGASHLKAETIADRVGISTKTVYRSIKRLVELKIIEKVASTKLNGIKGASIYCILPFVHNVPSEVSQRATDVEASNDEGPDVISGSLSIKSFNLLKSKQANNIYESANELALQAENKKAYMNDWQIMLYDFLHSLPMHDQIKDELHKIILSTQVNDVSGFHKAKNVFVNMLMDIVNGTLTVTSTLRAVFKGAYDKTVQYKPSTVVEAVEDQSERPVSQFYDWLNEREYAQ